MKDLLRSDIKSVLISEERYKKFLEKMDMVENEIKRVTSVIVPPKDANPLLEQYNSTAVKTGIRLSDMIKTSRT